MLPTILTLCGTLIAAVALCFVVPFELRPEQIEALWLVTPVMGAAAGLCFVVGELTKNTSQVDKLWSVMPVIYAGLFAVISDFNPRVTLAALVVTVWGVRLTWNFARRGGYAWPPWQGEEDYRWAIVQKKPLFDGHPLRWSLFNFFFICGYQMSLIYLFTLPVLVAWTDAPLGLWDAVLAVVGVALVAIEFVSDQQQYDYQTEKYRQKAAHQGGPTGIHAIGFVHTGLWRHVRHPNYAAEQLIWWCVYAFSVVGTGQLINPTIIGVLLLMMLFVGPRTCPRTSRRASTRSTPPTSRRRPASGRALGQALRGRPSDAGGA